MQEQQMGFTGEDESISHEAVEAKKEPWRTEKKRGVLMRPTDKSRTTSLGYQRPDGSFVLVPRSVRNKIVDLFDACNKSGFSPEDLKGIFDFSLQRAIETGTQPTVEPQ